MASMLVSLGPLPWWTQGLRVPLDQKIYSSLLSVVDNERPLMLQAELFTLLFQQKGEILHRESISSLLALEEVSNKILIHSTLSG